MTIKEYIERGKQLIADWKWAYACQDDILMDKFVKERQKMELEIMEKGDDFACEYFEMINN